MNKARQRQMAYAARDAQADKDRLSEEICRCVVSQPWYQQATTVLWYLHCRSEVRTLPALQRQLSGDKRIVAPYCTVDDYGDKCLGLWRLQSLDELQPGMWHIPEPPPARRGEPERCIQPWEVDVVMVPGVAFDMQGGRLGNGAGYYDRLLRQVRPDTVLAGVCYESQLLPRIILQDHDVSMDFVITERAVYTGQRSARQ